MYTVAELIEKLQACPNHEAKVRFVSQHHLDVLKPADDVSAVFRFLDVPVVFLSNTSSLVSSAACVLI